MQYFESEFILSTYHNFNIDSVISLKKFSVIKQVIFQILMFRTSLHI